MYRANAGRYRKPVQQNTWANWRLGAKKFNGEPQVTIKSEKKLEDNNNNVKSASLRWFWLRHQETRAIPRVVVDSDAYMPIAGPATWQLLRLHPKTVMMYCAFEHFQGSLLHYVSAVTAVDMANKWVIRLGVDRIVWIANTQRQELLLNVHHMRNAGATINSWLQVHGGEYQITTGNAMITWTLWTCLQLPLLLESLELQN